MHTDTPDTRTQFLATPQFGFAHLRGSLTRTEPNHDFLVVQFGAIAEAAPVPRPGRGFATGQHHGRHQP